MKVREEKKELKLKSAKELAKILAADTDKLREFKFKASQNQLKNIREIRKIRKKNRFNQNPAGSKI